MRRKRISRSGCSNCRLRKVSCDETRPHCKNCARYGTICSYVSGKPGTDIALFNKHENLVMLQVTGANEINSIPPRIFSWPYNRESELLQKFQLITAMTITVEPVTYLYQTIMVQKAEDYPFLRYAMLGLTVMHLLWLSKEKQGLLEVEAARYCSKAIADFSEELLKPGTSERQVMLRCTSGLLYNMAFAAIEGHKPEEAWPLARPSISDLGWLHTLNAKRAISRLATPIGSHPLYPSLSSFEAPADTSAESSCASSPLGFVSLFSLDSGTGSSNNPYFSSAIKFLSIWKSQDTIVVSGAFTIMLGGLADLKELLRQKDPRALILFACWYAKVSESGVWWYRRRAVLEGMAICVYLQRYHLDDLEIQVLLRYPKKVLEKVPY